jgi:hypothetical protein
MIAWLTKFISGFAFWRPPVIGKWLFYAIVFLVFMGAYNRIISPRPQQTRFTAQNATVINEAPKHRDAFFLGIKIWLLKIGVLVE